MISQQSINEICVASLLGQLPHPLQMRRPLGVEVLIRRPAKHQREHDLGEQHCLQMRFRLHRLTEPGLDLSRAVLRDHIPLPIRTRTGFELADSNLAVPR